MLGRRARVRAVPRSTFALEPLVAGALLGSCVAACGTSVDPTPPTASGSPWPRFRADAEQTGRAAIRPAHDPARAPWVYRTGKGIFSTPVIDGAENVYVGSADRSFRSLDSAGRERWSVETGEIIDSSALLDDRGLVYFGSGDGFLRALRAETGQEEWRFEADDPAENGAFIRWFEGNVAIAADGTLYAPNDNFYLYAIDRDTHEARWRFRMPDQTWSSPAVDLESGRLFIGNNNLLPVLGDNLFGIGADGARQFSASSLGSVAASPVFVREHGLMVAGGFDGYVRALHVDGDEAGTEAWSFATRDHLYASPALDSRGRVIQPSADGTVYALDAATGALVWQFDARDPFRGSPALDAADNVYVGGGDGRLYVLHADGTLRFRMRLIEGERNDLNGSPALGRDGAYLGGEDGGVYFVPYDYCLAGAGLDDPRCERGDVGEALPDDGVELLFLSRLGSPADAPPAEIDANRPLAFALEVREASDTALALLDTSTLRVELSPAAAASVVVSADRRFVTIVPEPRFPAAGDGKLQVRLQGDYLVEPERAGLRMSGGVRGGSFDARFSFTVHPGGVEASPFRVPAAPGGAASAFELRRLAAPLPTILPSYNQIGFDSMLFVGGLVEGTAADAVGWVVSGLPGEDGRARVDPATRTVFPVELRYRDGYLELENEGAFALEAYTVRLTFDRFRLSTRLDGAGQATGAASLFVSTLCGGIAFYGAFLDQLGFCNPDTGALTALGAALYAPWGDEGLTSPPAGLGDASFGYSPATGGSAARVEIALTNGTLRRDEHVFAVLLVDASTGDPVLVNYGLDTSVVATGDGVVTSISLELPPEAALPATVRAWAMVDVTPMAGATLDLGVPSP